MMFFRFFGLLLCLMMLMSCQKKEVLVVQMNSVRLYIPDSELKKRLAATTNELAEYMKLLVTQVNLGLSKASGQDLQAKGLFVAVGIKPNGQAKVWIEAVEGSISSGLNSSLEKLLNQVKPVSIRQNPFAFALELNIAGEKPKTFPELPQVWVNAAKSTKKGLSVPDDLFRLIWK